jgi:hypothetical protein
MQSTLTHISIIRVALTLAHIIVIIAGLTLAHIILTERNFGSFSFTDFTETALASQLLLLYIYAHVIFFHVLSIKWHHVLFIISQHIMTI